MDHKGSLMKWIFFHNVLGRFRVPQGTW
jgi:hypothetical protein